MNLEEKRRNYKKGKLDKETLSLNPYEQFIDWLNAAYQSDLLEPTAMVLSTVADRQPSSRVVLLKEVLEKKGFVFYTNYLSKKGSDIEKNPWVSLLFYWDSMERQIRIEGNIKKVEQEKSMAYFSKRPLESQISAIVSPQSTIIENKEELKEKAQEWVGKKQEVKKPLHWGGYIVCPHYFEFWQGRSNRFHDRFAYFLKEKEWEIKQLAP